MLIVQNAVWFRQSQFSMYFLSLHLLSCIFLTCGILIYQIRIQGKRARLVSKLFGPAFITFERGAVSISEYTE